MSQKPLYEVSLQKPDATSGMVAKNTHDVNQTRLNENFKRADYMFSELYDLLSETPVVPTKLSQLENDTGFINDVSGKQDRLTAGSNITIVNNVISATGGGGGGGGAVNSVNGQTGDVVLSASDVNALPDSTVIPTVPSNVSAFNNDAGYITGYTETDPTVPSWAKASSKPSYTAAEVGALPDTTVIPTVPSNISAFNNDSGYITGYTETDPTVPSWAKAPTKPTYTASEVGALPDTTVIPTVPTNVSAFNNDAGYISGYTETDPVFSASAAHGISSSDISSWNGKQNALTAGSGISIVNNVISATGGGGGGGGEQVVIDKLWQNSSTTTAFAAQKVSVDLSGYDLCGIVICAAYNSDAQFFSTMHLFPIGDGKKYNPCVLHGAANYNFGRPCTIATSGVTFETGRRNGSGGTTYGIPYRIFGIKGITFNVN